MGLFTIVPIMGIQLVMGNQSGDMDSICSAIGLSLILPNAIPIINIEKSEMSMRKDVLYLLGQVSIDPETLYYKDSLPFFLTLANEGKALMTLVDHNVLAPDQIEWMPYVNRIIDHHVDEVVNYPRLEEKIIAETGSCATLIAEISDLGILLLAPILLDTSNGQDERKTTPRDLKFIQDGDDLYQTLLAKKRDLEGLSPYQLLNRDFKMYQKDQCLYGISSLPHGIEWKSSEAAKEFMKEKNLVFLIILEWIGDQKFLLVFDAPWILDDPVLNELFVKPVSQPLIQLKEPLPRKVFQPILHSRIHPS